ncbi:hypothetical protein [Coralloluteibacterium thermophilus]|uniref:Lysozyme n=1 Tax=Coralloluteibacterium thermophilum TaxID=2707049 RepID=A0ABV9NNP3_9GAMM
MTRALIAVIAALVVVLGWQSCRLHDAQIALEQQRTAAETATAERERLTREASEEARDREDRHTQALAELAAQHMREREDDANEKRAAVAAAVRAGELRLREHWTCAGSDGMPATGAAAGERDAAAELRADAAARIVQLGAQCDADIRAAQAVIRGYMELMGGWH